MSLIKDYQDFLERREKALKSALSGELFNQEKRYMKPFKLYGNVYFVGDSWVCVHLIDTGDGLLLIDSGNAGATAMLVQAIWEAGFRPDDVKWIILSHGHIDHVGGALFFRRMFGTKLYLSSPDTKMFREHPEISLIQESPNVADEVFEPDAVIEDGDILKFGNVIIQSYLVPGHTEGCVALFFDAHDGNETKRCGYYGGFGFNTLTCKMLEETGDPGYHMWQTYRESIDKVINEPVDIFLGNHTTNNCVEEKLEAWKADPCINPFINPCEWKAFLGKMKAELEIFIKNELEKK